MVVKEIESKYIQTLISDIENNRLIPYFQPILDLKTKQILGVEVLARWEYEGKIINAGEFMKYVYELDIAHKVDISIFNSVSNIYSEYKKHVDTPTQLYFSFNLSTDALNKINDFDEVLSKSKLPLENVVFEITESIDLKDLPEDLYNLSNKYNFRIAMDDYGKENRQRDINQIIQTPIHLVKLDKIFIEERNLYNSELKELINNKKKKEIKAIVDIIKNAQKLSVLEGVETLEHLILAETLNIDKVQGYYVSKPVPLNELIEFFQSKKVENLFKQIHAA